MTIPSWPLMYRGPKRESNYITNLGADRGGIHGIIRHLQTTPKTRTGHTLGRSGSLKSERVEVQVQIEERRSSCKTNQGHISIPPKLQRAKNCYCETGTLQRKM